jgi:superfamily II DNA or RNA helicase
MKKAKCIRNTSTWSHIEKNQKFDTPGFKEKAVIKNLNAYSPRMFKLMENIQELDKKDLEENGKLFKHVIYSDVQGIYGSKMVASVLTANDYKMCYNKNLKLLSNIKNSFALLTSSVIYGKPFPATLKKDILSVFNERPHNIYGEKIRFIIIDSGYKEGIDLFDVKYFHILEPVITKAEETQILGRGLRFCGQAGLPFDPNNGWKLNVFKYNMKYTNDMDSFQLYLKHSNIDLSYINLTADLENLLRISAVDKHLIKNLYIPPKTRFDKLFSESSNKKEITVNVYGKLYHNNAPIKCKLKCHGPLQSTHNGLLLLAAINTNYTYYNVMNDKYPKNTLCNKLPTDDLLCKNVNELWMKPVQFLMKNGKSIVNKIDMLVNEKKISFKNYNDVMEFINLYYNIDLLNTTKNNLKPPSIFYNYLDLQQYIKINFKKLIWVKTKIENLCVKKEEEDIKLTPTQTFIKTYFTPNNINKGILLNHSVGTGKTCAAISTSVSFVKENYTILWVTRHTLKQDVWKNMFDKVCNSILGDVKDKKEKLKIIKQNWFPIISYKQFTNLIAKKNQYYKDLVKINGNEDPFKNTLIIIDEAHKLFTNDLKPVERPDLIKLKRALHNSYELSKNNSCKVVLLSATPITEDVMSLNKMLNLILPVNSQLPEDYELFKEKYCDINGLITTEGAISYINNISGIVSHLNRSGDIRQFAYPVYKDIMTVPPPTENYTEKLKLVENTLKNTKDKATIKTEIKELKKLKKTMDTAEYTNKLKILEEQLSNPVNIKTLKSDIKKLQDSAKNDHSVLNEINNCLAIKK